MRAKYAHACKAYHEDLGDSNAIQIKNHQWRLRDARRTLGNNIIKARSVTTQCSP